MGEKWIQFIKGKENKGQKRNWENSAWFMDREENVGNLWKKSIDEKNQWTK